MNRQRKAGVVADHGSIEPEIGKDDRRGRKGVFKEVGNAVFPEFLVGVKPTRLGRKKRGAIGRGITE